MEPQEKIIRDFFSGMEEQQGQSPKEMPPRSGEKYRFAWRAKGDEGKSYYEIFQMGDCLYLTADIQTLADNDEYQMLQLLNWLNGWSHYGIFTHAPHQKLVCYEQTHFCRYFEYTVEEIDDFYRQMNKRVALYHLSADDIFNNGTDIEAAVDMAREIVEGSRNFHPT
jgi:hypothetical protein